MISEVDLRDWEHLDTTPLYRVPRNTYIKVGDNYFFFEHIDGMYSFCLDLTNNVYHIMCTDSVIPLRKPV